MAEVVLMKVSDWYQETNECTEVTSWLTKSYDVRIEYGQSGQKQPVLFQIGTTEGPHGGYGFNMELRKKSGERIMPIYRDSSGLRATSKPVCWLLPGEVYVLDIHFMPSVYKRIWYTLGFVKRWVPRYNFYIKASKQGDGHVAEFGR